MHVFHALGHYHPRMHALLVHREGGRRELWIRESAHRDCYGFDVVAFDGVEDRGSADWTEVECDSAALVAHADPGTGSACDVDGRAREAGLRSEDTASSALACKAVTYRDAHGLPGNGRRELAATARCLACSHERKTGCGCLTPNASRNGRICSEQSERKMRPS